jgi:broad specificity phosphatase PhoE
VSGPNLTLIRHGETTWSASGQHTGRTDLGLTPAGEGQARELARVLAGRHFDLVLSSPLRRARHTAELAGLGRFQVDDDLREWDYGELEGLTTPEIRRQYPGWSIWAGPWPGGETDSQVTARVDRVIERCRALAAGAEVALVAHGHILRVLGARWIGQPAAGGQWLALGTAARCGLGWEHDQPVITLWNLLCGTT